jgi:hypothetical protein
MQSWFIGHVFAAVLVTIIQQVQHMTKGIQPTNQYDMALIKTARCIVYCRQSLDSSNLD